MTNIDTFMEMCIFPKKKSEYSFTYLEQNLIILLKVLPLSRSQGFLLESLKGVCVGLWAS